MKVYKLTEQNFLTLYKTLWGENVTHETKPFVFSLCNPGCLHYYYNPYLAVLLNPIHADIVDPILWEAEAEGEQLDDHGLKGGCTKLTTIRQLPLPKVTLEQRVEFAIQCAMKCKHNTHWKKWADNWLSGKGSSIAETVKLLKFDPSTSFTVTGSPYYSSLKTAYYYLTNKELSTKKLAADTIELAANERENSVFPLDLNQVIKQVFPNYKG